jgi:hypothetical protein
LSVERERDDVAHQARVIAEVLGQSILWPLQLEDGLVFHLRLLFRLILDLAPGTL